MLNWHENKNRSYDRRNLWQEQYCLQKKKLQCILYLDSAVVFSHCAVHFNANPRTFLRCVLANKPDDPVAAVAVHGDHFPNMFLLESESRQCWRFRVRGYRSCTARPARRRRTSFGKMYLARNSQHTVLAIAFKIGVTLKMG